MKLGVENLLENPANVRPLEGRRVALLATPASVDHRLRHSAELLFQHPKISLVSAFGAQHGLRGEKQDNMVESGDYVDPVLKIPVFSLYGETRRPTKQMMDSFDVVLVDMQDIGCRIYTFITTLLYMLEACAEHGKELWVLDRPNPPGRPVEGLTLRKGNESFVGSGPLPMRHGLTLGEVGRWFVRHYKLDVKYRVVEMTGYDPNQSPGFGWPLGEIPWVNPSPNIATLNAVRAFAGTVLLEGTTLSEGRGTTRALELVGAPELNANKILKEMHRAAPDWLKGAILRECYFEPTFHKHKGELCHGMQLHTDFPEYDHAAFKPFRVISLFLKSVRRIYPDYPIWRDFHYEYVTDRLAIDVINGGPLLREWVDDPTAQPADLEHLLAQDEKAFLTERRDVLIYGE